MEKDFIDLLEQVTPKTRYVDLFMEIVRDRWHSQNSFKGKLKEKASGEIERLEKKKQTLVDKNLDGVYSDALFKQQMKKIKEQLVLARKQQEPKRFKDTNINPLTKKQGRLC